MMEIKLEKSLDYILEVISTGNGGLNQASYKNVKSLDIFQYLEIKKDLVEVKEYKCKNEFFNNNKSYRELLKEAKDEISNNIKAVLNYKRADIKISHLTGGFDSRLILAAILDTKKQDEVYFYTSGSKELPDKIIAEGLAREYDLKMTNFSGFPMKSSEELLNNEISMIDFSGGIINGGADDNYNKCRNIVISGAYGECFRSFFDSRYDDSDTINSVEGLKEMLPKIWGNVMFGTDHDNSLLNEEFKTSIAKKIKSIFDESNTEALFDYMYLKIRCRYYVGAISNSWSRIGARFDALYTLKGISCNMKLSKKERKANIIGLDLMDLFCPNLKEWEFDSKKINDEYIELRGPVLERKFTEEKEIQYYLNEYINNTGNQKVVITRDHIERAKKIKGSAYQVALADEVKIKLKDILSVIGIKEINKIFNRKILMRLINSKNDNRVNNRILINIYYYLCWYIKK